MPEMHILMGHGRKGARAKLVHSVLHGDTGSVGVRKIGKISKKRTCDLVRVCSDDFKP